MNLMHFLDSGIVSTHAPVMGATIGHYGDVMHIVDVSTHAPVMGATTRPWPTTPAATSFNPRARDGRDALSRGFLRAQNVSTHAPVMGATLVLRNGFTVTGVSTHAPVMGATPSSRAASSW